MKKIKIFLKKYLIQQKYIILLLVPFSLLLTSIAKGNSALTETVFSLGFYKVYSLIVSNIFGIFPFSMAEFLLIGSVFATVILFIISVFLTIKYRKFTYIINYTKYLTFTLSVIYFIFTISCGLNYYRLSFKSYYGDTPKQYSVEELAQMCETFIAEADTARSQIDLNEHKLSKIGADYFESLELSEFSNQAFSDLSKIYPVLNSNYSKPKSVILSNLMSEIRITGVFFPWTIEANVNTAVPYYQIPFTMLHEQAHQCGFMSEDEANFIAWLAGKNANDPVVKYSTYMAAANYAMNSLYSADKDLWSEVYDNFSEAQLTDKDSSYKYWKQFETPVADTWTKVNDNYLKSNGQTQGVISYGNVTELLLMDFYQN